MHGQTVFFQVWYMSDLHYRISAVKTAVEMQKFLASSEFWHSKWRLPGTPKNQVFHYGFLRGSHGKLWCSHGLRTGSPKPGFLEFTGFVRVLVGFLRVLFGFLRCSHGFCTGCAIPPPQFQLKSGKDLKKVIQDSKLQTFHFGESGNHLQK